MTQHTRETRTFAQCRAEGVELRYGKACQPIAFPSIEPKHLAEPFDNARRDAPLPRLEAGIPHLVNAGQRRDLRSPQAGASASTTRLQINVRRSQAVPSNAEQRSELVTSLRLYD